MEQIKPSDNKPEKFRPVNLEIKKPDGLHQWEIIFEENDVALITAYNAALNEVGNIQNKLGIFHQTGRGNEAGYHAWEFLGSSPGKGEIEKLTDLIHKEAEANYKKYKEMRII